MLSAIKLATINQKNYYYHPLDQDQDDLIHLENQFLQTDLDWISNLDLDQIIFYEQNFQNWWTTNLAWKQSAYLYKAKQYYDQAKITYDQVKTIFAKFKLDFNNYLYLNWKEFAIATNVHKNLQNLNVFALRSLLFKSYYHFKSNDKDDFIIDAQLDQTLVQSKLLAAKQAIENQGLIPIFIFLQGAHNYGLDDANSDYDFKALVINVNHPFNHNFKVATITYSQQNELIDCKSWIHFKQLLSQFHYPYLELLKTKALLIKTNFYPFWNDLKKLLSANLAHNEYLIKRSIIGQMSNKLDALNKSFASKQALIKQFGYDPKQAHHYFRLKSVLSAIADQGLTINSLWPDYDQCQKAKLIAIKRDGVKKWPRDQSKINDLKIKLQKNFETSIVHPWKQMPQRQNQKALIATMLNQLDQLDLIFFNCLDLEKHISNKKKQPKGLLKLQ